MLATKLDELDAMLEQGGVEADARASDPYMELQQLVKERGPYRRTSLRILAELSLHVGMMMGGIAGFLLFDNIAIKVVSILVSTFGCLGISTNAHTSSHYATTDSRRVNRVLTYMGYPFCFGLSASYWWYKHCFVHHPAPNIVGVDDDIDLAPFFTVLEPDIARSSGLLRFYYHRMQWVIVPFALALNELNIQLTGYRHLARVLRDPAQRRPTHWVDVGVLALHWVTWVILPMLFFPPLYVLGFYLLRMALMGYAMFIAFAPAHFPDEAAAAAKGERAADFVLRQTSTTVNFRTGLFGRLLCSGVEYQIEHHLFPHLSHHHYAEISKIVQEFCRQRGYPYRTLGWWEGVWKSLAAFYRPKKVHHSLEVYRNAAVPS